MEIKDWKDKLLYRQKNGWDRLGEGGGAGDEK